MKELLSNNFPKQIGIPNRILCKTPKEYFETFKKVSGTFNKVYTSLYDIQDSKHNYKSKIHLVAFDLDNEDRLENTKKIHYKLKEMNLRHCIIFSTKGFWVYVLNKNYENINFNKDALANAHDYLAEKFGLLWGKSKDSDLDVAIYGDIARISRAVGSYDIPRKRYCIPVTIEDLEKGMDYIIEKSQKSSIKIKWYCKDKLDFLQFDYKNTKIIKNQHNDILDSSIFNNIEEVKYDYSETEVNGVLKYFLPIVRNWLLMPEGADFKQRYYTTVYMVQLGLPDDMIENVCKRYFTKNIRTDGWRNNYNHWKKHNVLNQAHREGVQFPRIEFLFKNGHIKGATLEDFEKYNKLYARYYNIDEIRILYKNSNLNQQLIN